jgi:hypothetical protein
MKKAAIVLLVGVMAGQHAFAGDTGSGDKSSGSKGESTIVKVGNEVGHGIQRGADAAGRGIKKGGRAAGNGLETAAKWVERKIDKHEHGGKKEDK